MENQDEKRNDQQELPFRGIHIKISATGASHGIIATEGVTYFEIYGVLKVLLAKLEKDLNISK